MKLRLLFALPALLLASLFAHAQAYESGLLVRANGDTLRGEIENSFWVEAPEYIHFRLAPDSPSQLFQPRQLRAVSFSGGRYFRYEAVPINHAARMDLNQLPRGYATDVRTDSLLVEVLLESPVALLRVVQNGIVHYLIRRPGQPYLELSEQNYLRETATGSWAVINGNNYQGLLNIYFGDCAAAAEVAKTIPFTLSGLADVVQTYTRMCTTNHSPGRSWLALAAPRRRVSAQAGLMAGLRYNHIASVLNLNEYEYLDNRPHPVAGLFAEVFLPSRTTYIYGELGISPFRGRQRLYSIASYSSYPGPGPGGYISYDFSYADYTAWLGTARIGMRWYSPLQHSQQLVLGLSYGLGWVLRPRFSTVTTGSSNGPTVTQPASANLAVPRLGFATQTPLPALAIGWRVQHLTLLLEGQRCYDDRDQSNVIGSNLLGSSWFTRLTTSYRLGRNPDARHTAAASK